MTPHFLMKNHPDYPSHPYPSLGFTSMQKKGETPNFPTAQIGHVKKHIGTHSSPIKAQKDFLPPQTLKRISFTNGLFKLEKVWKGFSFSNNFLIKAFLEIQ